MKVRRALTAIVGVIQSMIAIFVFIFACIAYFGFYDIQTTLNAGMDFLYFHLLALLVFGSFFMMNGLFLVYEWLESR